MFTFKTQIYLRDTDAAGIIFFARQFNIIHDTYELFLEKIGFSFTKVFKENKFFFPIVHAESTYKSPLHVGDRIQVSVKVGHLGNSSFVLLYDIHNTKGRLVGTAKTVHVAIKAKSSTKIPLPKTLRQALQKHLIPTD